MRGLLLILSFHTLLLFANDGAFYAHGNQLIPIVETDISVRKEVLSIQRIEGGYLRIIVTYIFDNPGESKNILVGFEAPSPAGDVDGTPVNGRHPYISNFSVLMNGKPLKYEVALVNDNNYYQNGKVEGMDEKQAMGDSFNENDPDFYYVYHFNAQFQPNTNIIQHTYNFKLSTSVMENYSFGYILSAANRWANNGIDDFTLILDLGDFQDFFIAKTFFKDKNDWILNGKMFDLPATVPPYLEDYRSSLQTYCKHGPMVFSKKNFHPNGELYIHSAYKLNSFDFKEFDATKHSLPFDIQSSLRITNSLNLNSHVILRNLPYARRGFAFKTEFIREFYASQQWYTPDPNYISSRNDLSQSEQDWLKQLVEP